MERRTNSTTVLVVCRHCEAAFLDQKKGWKIPFHDWNWKMQNEAMGNSHPGIEPNKNGLVTPLDRHRVAKVAAGSFCRIVSGGWMTTVPKDIAIGSLVRVRQVAGVKRKEHEVEDETGRIILLPAWHPDPGMEFHIAGVNGWWSESHPQVLEFLPAELDGRYRFPGYQRSDDERRMITERNRERTWRGVKVKPW